MTSVPRPVSRAGRAMDVLALLLVLAGATGYVVSYVGLERLRAAPPAAFSPGMPISRLAEYQRLATLSHWALAGVLAGVLCALASWWLERRRNQRLPTA